MESGVNFDGNPLETHVNLYACEYILYILYNLLVILEPVKELDSNNAIDELKNETPKC